jgi:hypothetical protein
LRSLRVLFVVIAIGAVVASVLVAIIGPSGVQLGTLWHGAAPESLNLTQAVTQRYIHPVVWTHLLLPVLLTPALVVFAVIAVVALLCWFLLRRRHQYN